MEQTNEAVVQKNRGGKRVKQGGRTPLIILGTIVGVLVLAYIGLCAWATCSKTIWRNTCILREDVGGLTVKEAAAKLEASFADMEIEVYLYEENQALPTHESEPDAVVSVSDLAGTLDAEKLVTRAYQVTRSNFLSSGWRYLETFRYNGDNFYAQGAIQPDADQTRAIAQALSAALSSSAQNAAYEVREDGLLLTIAQDGREVASDAIYDSLYHVAWAHSLAVDIPYRTLTAKPLTAQQIHDEIAGEMKNAGYDAETGTITPEKLGAEFDVSAAQKKIDAAQPGETIEISAVIEYPSVTAEALKGVLFRDVLGECKTHVSGTAARINNVKLSASTINGYVMNTGDVFSYNETVGQRTAANGYQAAPAYVKGETVDEIGGGICQTSSTLYLACLRGNLEITERYAHRYVPAYIPWGMDATVSWGGPDYKFTNDTDYPIKIVTEYSKNYLTVKILGTNMDGSYSKVTNEVLSQTDWETVYEVDETLAPGTADTVKTTPYTGYNVKTYHTIYDKNGNVIDSHYEDTSDYKVRNKVVVRAPAPAEPVTPVETPVAPGTPTDTESSQEASASPSDEPVVIVLPTEEELIPEA